MDSFEIDNVKAEKRNAMLKYRRVRKIGILFRFFEICLAFIFLSWFSTRLPLLVQISGDYFKDLSVFVVSPRFVFLIGNAIILTLFAKSGQFPSGRTSPGTDLYDEYIKSSDNCQKISISTTTTTTTTPAEEIVVVEDKQIDKESSVTEIHTAGQVTASVIAAMDTKIYRRSQSVNINHSMSEKQHERELRRTETDICRNMVEIPGKMSEKKKKMKKKSFVDDHDEEMSNEEFQRKIEAFIAKQMRFHKEESMAIVLQNQSREPVSIIRSREIKV